MNFVAETIRLEMVVEQRLWMEGHSSLEVIAHARIDTRINFHGGNISVRNLIIDCTSTRYIPVIILGNVQRPWHNVGDDRHGVRANDIGSKPDDNVIHNPLLPLIRLNHLKGFHVIVEHGRDIVSRVPSGGLDVAPFVSNAVLVEMGFPDLECL